MSSKEPGMSSKEPEMSSKEPGMSCKEPEMSFKEPGMSFKEPGMSCKEPEMSCKEPEMSFKEPGMSFKEPEMSSKEPGMSCKEPEMSSKEPEMSFKEPEMSFKEPEMSSEEPEMSSKEPEMSCKEPEMSFKEPEMSSEEPEMSFKEPGMSSEEPGMSSGQPEMSSEEPEMSFKEPGMSSEEPGMSSEEPEMSSKEPGMSSEEPGMSSEEPEMSSGQPEMSSKEPGMSSGQPADASQVAAAGAGRLVMDVMQSEWEPMSHCELEQRLDQAVEEILEAELICGLEAQLSQQNETISHTENSHAPTASFIHHPEGEPERENEQNITETQENPTVQYLVSLLQNLKWTDGQRRLTGRSRLSLSHTVSLSLTLVSTRLSYRAASSRFRLEKGNIHRIFFTFCHRVNALQSHIIRWPTGEEAFALLLPFSSELDREEKLKLKGLPKVLGVLGHTRVPIRLRPGKQEPESDAPPDKRLRKCPRPNSWLNLELVCDAEGRFIHCSVGSGSHKNRGEALRRRLTQNPELLPPGTCLLAGASYPLTQQILTPFRHAQNHQENLYNRALETHLRRLEEATARLKERFRRLRYLDMGRSERAGAVVLTCCILHTALQNAGYTTTSTAGQLENHTEEEEEEEQEEGVREEAGVRLRETVADLLYRALRTGTEEHEEDEQGQLKEHG